ncbi:methyl-accepting chemotaxis protein [Acetobacteraceae bacterium KSS8]|uniref:Methyl-accepting chemotaxis protein n=1 Tax=Endosaccharibacter trunci TaxID=2812733 RepID=A0ABT1W903_9PROT|nr:methyl-accepting chemotaxis protein [Acetobacteraceae bacterium KSS8]
MTISKRLLLGFGFTMVMMLGIGLLSVSELADVGASNEAVVTRDMAAYRQADVVHDSHAEMTRLRQIVWNEALKRRLGVNTTQGFDAAVAAWQQQSELTMAGMARLHALVTDYANHITTGYSRHQNWVAINGMLPDLDATLQQVQTDTRALFAVLRTNDDQAAAAAETTLLNDRRRFDGELMRLNAALDESVQLGRIHIAQAYTESVWSIAIALLLALAVSVTITVLSRRAVVGPIGRLTEVAERIGGGDLTVHAPESGRSEIARLGGAINRMVDGLRAIAVQSREATGNLNVSVAEIRASTQEQAAGVEEQLAAVQETAATVDEIAHSGAQISRRAQDVIATAQATQLASENGLRAVRESGRAMEQVQQQGEAVAANIVALSEKTEAIGEIVNSVNDISERSHLLALNAAIEAASAGEHGRSFAVVATEMKILADQAKDATAQVRTILGDIQRGINTSVMLTEEAVKRGAAGRERTQTAEATIEDMAAGIQDAVQTFQQIVASTNQQQLGIEQVMVALQNIRQASQQTASGTRQLESAAHGLGELSRQLMATSERFRT